MQDVFAALPLWAPTALNLLAGVAAVLPLVLYVGRAVRTRRWRFVVRTRGWRAAVAVLVVCPTVVGLASAVSTLAADAQRLADQGTEWAQGRMLDVGTGVLLALQERYEVNLAPDGYVPLSSVDDGVTVDVVPPGARGADETCVLALDPVRVRELAGDDLGYLVPSEATVDELAGAHVVTCGGAELEPQGALLGVVVQTELAERTWPGHRAPRALAGGALMGLGIGLLLVFLGYSLSVVDRSGGGPSRGDALLADLKERIRRDPTEREAVIDSVAAAVEEADAQQARAFAALPLEDLLVTMSDDVDLTHDAFLTEYLVDTGRARRPATHDPAEAARAEAALQLALDRQRDVMAKDPEEVARVRAYVADLVDRLNAEVTAQREAGLAGTHVSSGIDRDAVVITDDLLREHLVATGAISATEMAAPGLPAYLRGLAWSALFVPTIGLLAWVMTAFDDGDVPWRWETVATQAGVDAFVAHYEELGVDVELPADREGLEAVAFYNDVEGTRGTDTCFGWVISGRALLQCGPSTNERDWT